VIIVDLLDLITVFGYPVILVGAFVEGEVTLVLGGFAAHRGYLDLPLVIACAFVGAFFGDQFFFYLGRHRSRVFLERHPDWRARISSVERYIDRFRTAFVLGFRFIYGLRTVSPFVLGMGDIRHPRFAVLDAISALAWAIGVAWLGYVFGNVMELIIEDIEHYEMEVFGLILIAGLSVWLGRAYRKRKAVQSA
jgi:membrane protein DedA with SNARE-associated domain